MRPLGKKFKADYPGKCSANCGQSWGQGTEFFWDKIKTKNQQTGAEVEVTIKCTNEECFKKQGGSLESNSGGQRQGKTLQTRITQVTALDGTIYPLALQRAKQALGMPLEQQAFANYVSTLEDSEKFTKLSKIAELAFSYANALALGFNA